MTEQKLRECPHCGGSEIESETLSHRQHTIRCLQCSIVVFRETELEAIGVWNKRHADQNANKAIQACADFSCAIASAKDAEIKKLRIANEQIAEASKMLAKSDASMTRRLEAEISRLKNPWEQMTKETQFNEGDEVMVNTKDGQCIHCRFQADDPNNGHARFVSVRCDAWENQDEFTRAEIAFFLRIIAPIPFNPNQK